MIEVMAHEEGANSVSQSYVVKGMITSVGQKVILSVLQACHIHIFLGAEGLETARRYTARAGVYARR